MLATLRETYPRRRASPKAVRIVRCTWQRRRIFTAALNQAEELSIAASGVSYAARPLLEFYSLSQAGRAIAAAHLVGKAELIGPSAASCRPRPQ